ncbi:MAG: dihydropteroate synthase [Crocinitomicaceae bacterium]|nr:dihydropteroate synthase [Crocinitomicaceae bacterium]
MKNSRVEDTNYNAIAMNINGNLMDFKVPKVMGILNVTDNSFYEGSRLTSDIELLKKAELHLSEGADILDLGGFSTRPGSQLVDEEMELNRIKNALYLLKKEFPTATISVDTFRGKVAEVAIKEGASIINDISGFQFDNSLLATISKYDVTYVLMHIAESFDTMHDVSAQTIATHSENILEKVATYFKQKIGVLNQQGISNIVIDPGFGFSKTLKENYTLLHQLDFFHQLNCPVLVGISRKSMIYKELGITPEESLNGTTALHALAILKGASILRVHDVKPCKQVIDLLLY